jgi:hypothetical protein
MGDAHALRLTFAYRDGQIRLLGSERIATIAPAPVTPPPDAGQTGYWFGVLDAAGRVLRQGGHRAFAARHGCAAQDAASCAHGPHAVAHGRT